MLHVSVKFNPGMPRQTLTAHDTKKILFTSKFDLNLRKELLKCYIWSTALCGAEIWTLRKVDQRQCVDRPTRYNTSHE